VTKATGGKRSLERPSTALRVVSPEVAEVGRAIRRWRDHLAETKSFVRLAVAYLQSYWPNAEQRAHVGDLFAIEARTLTMLPSIETSDLHTGLTPHQSGITPVRPDATRAAHYLRALRERVCAWLRAVSSAAQSGVAIEPLARALDGATSELVAACELFELLLFPREVDPIIECAEAVARAADASRRKLTIESTEPAHVGQVRGLLRLLSAILVDVEEGAVVRVSSTITRACVEVPSTREAQGEDRWAFLKFCAYLGRMRLERDEVRALLLVPLAVL
jgi:hypothetical protein